MNAKEKKMLVSFAKETVKQVAYLEDKPADSEEVKRLMSTPDSKMILRRAFYNWAQEETTPTWSRRKIMNYGAHCAARSIVMSKMPMRD